MTHFTTAPGTRARRGVIAAAALFLACAAPVPAARALAAPETSPAAHRHADADDWLYVTVTRGDTRTADTRGALLRCDPPRGHSRAEDACAQLRSAGGDVRAIPHRDAFCSMIYAPVTVRAGGRWQGRAIDYTETFPNACVMRARTGDVFALDE
ncbi:SSI family serine proteinase inhibitor [Streptomyces mexicanus]|uniref:Serine protease n=1 Tax=Streptomyces mexicanus TaxID=178566 RepID=A0A7X1LTW5_9ACTN|nr:SSI family serine proteinase inhibitor [Streptomyces mexicanus]MBC2869725.1 serine protease [Streptomyces mexicanus]